LFEELDKKLDKISQGLGIEIGLYINHFWGRETEEDPLYYLITFCTSHESECEPYLWQERVKPLENVKKYLEVGRVFGIEGPPNWCIADEGIDFRELNTLPFYYRRTNTLSKIFMKRFRDERKGLNKMKFDVLKHCTNVIIK